MGDEDGLPFNVCIIMQIMKFNEQKYCITTTSDTVIPLYIVPKSLVDSVGNSHTVCPKSKIVNWPQIHWKITIKWEFPGDTGAESQGTYHPQNTQIQRGMTQKGDSGSNKFKTRLVSVFQELFFSFAKFTNENTRYTLQRTYIHKYTKMLGNIGI